VPVDQIGSPTYAPNLAEAVVELATKGIKGLFHIVGPALANRYQFAMAVAQKFNLDPSLIEPVSTAELGQAAPRPLKAGMRVEKAQGILQTRLIDYQEGLQLMFAYQPKQKFNGI